MWNIEFVAPAGHLGGIASNNRPMRWGSPPAKYPSLVAAQKVCDSLNAALQPGTGSYRPVHA